MRDSKATRTERSGRGWVLLPGGLLALALACGTLSGLLAVPDDCPDALITAETKKLEALKRHKRGLMQQLFPTSAEVEA